MWCWEVLGETLYFVHNGMSFSDEGVFPRSFEDDHVDAVQFTNLVCFQGCYLGTHVHRSFDEAGILASGMPSLFPGCACFCSGLCRFGPPNSIFGVCCAKNRHSLFSSHDIHVIDSRD